MRWKMKSLLLMSNLPRPRGNNPKNPKKTNRLLEPRTRVLLRNFLSNLPKDRHPNNLKRIRPKRAQRYWPKKNPKNRQDHRASQKSRHQDSPNNLGMLRLHQLRKRVEERRNRSQLQKPRPLKSMSLLQTLPNQVLILFHLWM